MESSHGQEIQYPGSADGKVAPIRGELTFHCFPDKINVQAIFHMQEKVTIRRAELVCDVSGMQESRPGSMVFVRGARALGIEYNPKMVELSKHNAEAERFYISLIFNSIHPRTCF